LPCRVEDLAAEQGVPPQFLIQILIALKAKQIVISQRGKDGGYLLARPPGEITFGEVLRAVEGDLVDTPALKDPRCPAELRRLWLELRTAVEDTTGGITFQELADAGAEHDRMYYI